MRSGAHAAADAVSRRVAAALKGGSASVVPAPHPSGRKCDPVPLAAAAEQAVQLLRMAADQLEDATDRDGNTALVFIRKAGEDLEAAIAAAAGGTRPALRRLAPATLARDRTEFQIESAYGAPPAEIVKLAGGR